MPLRRSSTALVPLSEISGTCDTKPGLFRIPSFSIEDRRERVAVEVPWLFTLARSNLAIGFAFMCSYILPHRLGVKIGSEWLWVCIFIVLHLFVTIGKSVPDVTSTPDELNRRTNASIFVAMVLYPALGVWSCQKFSEADNLVTFQRQGEYLWGTIFPVFMWGMSALVLVRDSYHSITVDCSAVVSSEGGGSGLGLFRRYPSMLERFTNRLGYFLTGSLWHLLPPDLRPAGGAGRFTFQLLAPVVLLFLYIGLRFILYSAQMIQHMWSCWPAPCLDDWRSVDRGLVEGTFYIWTFFTAYCIIIRGFVPSPLFLRLTVTDPATRKWLSVKWPIASAESKRQRVLWAFRGLANSMIPWFYTVQQPLPEKVKGSLHLAAWYLLFGVHVSFLMEGVGALFFALHEAERGCHLKTPFAYFMKQSFWASYNTFLQPCGTAINLSFALINGEFSSGLNLREFWGPLLNERGEFRSWLRCESAKAAPLTEADLEDWIETWKRKRESVGKPLDSLDIVRCEKPPETKAPRIFEGTAFPTWHERVAMMSQHTQHISLKPWEIQQSGEKFERWYNTHAEEVKSLLSEPYNFHVKREVWVWGYGSLMSPDSPPAGLSERQRKLFLPYWMKREAGYQRCWNYRHGSVGINALGLRKVDDDQAENICGIAYPMDYESASELFSKREDGYRLLLLQEHLLEPMHPDYRIPNGCGYVWIVGEPILKCPGPENYNCADSTCKRHGPTQDSPILQSYVDEIITGCFKYSSTKGKNDGMKFAAAVIQSIHGWERPWYNDRILAGRPWKFAAEYELIDGLLNTCPTSHAGFVKRLRPALCPSPVLGNLLENKFQSSQAWSASFFGPEQQLSPRMTPLPSVTLLTQLSSRAEQSASLERHGAEVNIAAPAAIPSQWKKELEDLREEIKSLRGLICPDIV